MPKENELYEAFFWLLSLFQSTVREESVTEIGHNEEQFSQKISLILNFLIFNSPNCLKEDECSDTFLLLLRTIAFIPQFSDFFCNFFKDLQWKRQMMLILFEKLQILKIISQKRLEFLSNTLSLPPFSREEKISLSKVKLQAIELDSRLVEHWLRIKNEPEVSFNRKLLLRLLEVEYQIVLDSYARLLMEIQMNSCAKEGYKIPYFSKEALDRLPFQGRPFTILPSARDRIKAKVFGPSHSLPTMTIDEYLELERKRGGILDTKPPTKEPEEITTSAYDSKEVYRLREFDAFKDDNPRGSGNRMGKS
jgi:hypothetical protein